MCMHEQAIQYQKLPGNETIGTIDLDIIILNVVSFPDTREIGHNTTETELPKNSEIFVI